MSRPKPPPNGGPRLKKIRPDAVLHQLPEEQQMEICALMAKHAAYKVSEMLLSWSPPVKVTPTSLYRFAEHWRSELRFLHSSVQREALLAQMLLKQAPAKLAKLKIYADALFLQTAVTDNNLEGYVKLRTLMERSEQTRLDERRIKILEEKEGKLTALEKALTDKKSAGGLTPETLSVIESALGMMQ